MICSLKGKHMLFPITRKNELLYERAWHRNDMFVKGGNAVFEFCFVALKAVGKGYFSILMPILS